MATESNKPVKQYRRRAIGVSIWKKEINSPEHGTQTFYSATASRAFKPKDAAESDPFQYSDNFDADDLPIVSALLTLAFMWIATETNKGK